MAAYNYSLQTFDAQSLTAAPFTTCKFLRQNSPIRNVRPMRPVAAEVVELGTQDVRAQPQPAIWEIYCELTNNQESTLADFQEVFSEDRGLAFLVANDGDATAWRVQARTIGVDRLPGSLTAWLARLWLPNPIWEQNAQVTGDGATNMTGTGATDTVTNAGSRKAFPIHTIDADAVKTVDTNSYLRSFRGFWYNPSTHTLSKFPLCLTDVSGADSAIDHQAEVTAGAQADGDDVRVWHNGVQVERWLAGANTTTFRVWINVDAPPVAKVTLEAATTAGSPADGGNLDVNEDISRFPEAGFVVIEDEAITYQSRDVEARQFKTIERGAFGSTAAVHAINTAVFRGDGEFVVSARNDAAVQPPDDIDRRPAIVLAGGANGSKNNEWRYGQDSDDGSTVFYDRDNPDRSAMFTPSLVQPSDDKARGLRLEEAKVRAGFQDSAAIAGKAEQNQLLLTLPQGIEAVANAITYDVQRRGDIYLRLIGVDDAGEREVLVRETALPKGTSPDQQVEQATLATAQNLTPSKRLNQLLFSAVRRAVLGNNSSGNDTVEVGGVTGEGLFQKFVLDGPTKVKGIACQARVPDTGLAAYDAVIRDDSGATPDLGNLIIKLFEGGAPDSHFDTTTQRTAWVLTKTLFLPAATYWFGLEFTTGGGDGVIGDIGPTETKHDHLYEEDASPAFLYGSSLWLRVYHDDDGPIQQESEDLDGGLEAYFDNLILALDDGSDRQVPYVHRVGGWTNGLYHLDATLKNNTTSQEIALDYWMALGATFEINCETQKVTYTEGQRKVNAAGAITPTDETEWMRLDPGANTLEYAGNDEVNTDWDVKHRGRRV